jgi:uncharacterized membrane protein
MPRAFVFRADLARAFLAWLQRNWFLAMAALSLMLAGVFLVQYGIEQGLLTPALRVAGAAALGAVLIGGGEWIRRRAASGAGDTAGDVAGDTAHLPSTFAGAGLAVLAVAALSARHLYGMIGAEAAFVALLAVAALAVALGWFYGPFLAAAGLLGGLAAPFVVGGGGPPPAAFYGYSGALVVAGLLIDAVRRWAWVSVLVLVAGHAAAWVHFAAGAGAAGYLAFALAVALAAVALPPLSFVPRHGGPSVTEAALRRGRGGWPEFPTRLGFGAGLAALGAAGLVQAAQPEGGAFWLVVAAIALLYLAAVMWMAEAPALEDLAFWAGLAFVAAVAAEGLQGGATAQAFRAAADRLPEIDPPRGASWLAAAGLAGSALAFWRSGQAARWPLAWAGLAAALAPAVLVALELWWRPRDVLGAGAWAFHPMIAAAAMTLAAERSARADGADRRRAGLFALSALSLIAFALMLLLTDTALTLALAVMVALAAGLDRWQRLPALALFVQAAALLIGWRLVPGAVIHDHGRLPLWEVALLYAGSLALLVAAAHLLRPLGRETARMVLDSVAWTAAAVFGMLLIERLPNLPDHVTLTLMALVWLAAVAGQLWRLQSGGGRLLRALRLGLAALYGLIAAALLLVVALVENPLVERGEPVAGPPLADSLLLAFGLPALVFGTLAWRLAHLPRRVRQGAALLSAAYGAAWAGLEIRRLWRGPELTVPGTTDPELYSYTLAMLAASAALLLAAFLRRSATLRRAAMLGIVASVAKVYLIDMAGLAGLARVASFLGLGLSLAGLAWLYRVLFPRPESPPPAGSGTPAA